MPNVIVYETQGLNIGASDVKELTLYQQIIEESVACGRTHGSVFIRNHLTRVRWKLETFEFQKKETV